MRATARRSLFWVNLDPLPPAAHPDAELNPKCLVPRDSGTLPKRENVFSGVETMDWKEFNLFGRNWVEHSFKTLVDRRIRAGRREERRLAEQRTTKHRLQARKSCIADARSYRVARRLSLLATAQLD